MDLNHHYGALKVTVEGDTSLLRNITFRSSHGAETVFQEVNEGEETPIERIGKIPADDEQWCDWDYYVAELLDMYQCPMKTYRVYRGTNLL